MAGAHSWLTLVPGQLTPLAGNSSGGIEDWTPPGLLLLLLLRQLLLLLLLPPLLVLMLLLLHLRHVRACSCSHV
jgi:hypothetical protein